MMKSVFKEYLKKYCNVSLQLYHLKTAFPWLGKKNQPRTVGLASKESDRLKMLQEQTPAPGSFTSRHSFPGPSHDVRNTAQKSCHVDNVAWGHPYRCVSASQWKLTECVVGKGARGVVPIQKHVCYYLFVSEGKILPFHMYQFIQSIQPSVIALLL